MGTWWDFILMRTKDLNFNNFIRETLPLKKYSATTRWLGSLIPFDLNICLKWSSAWFDEHQVHCHYRDLDASSSYYGCYLGDSNIPDDILTILWSFQIFNILWVSYLQFVSWGLISLFMLGLLHQQQSPRVMSGICAHVLYGARVVFVWKWDRVLCTCTAVRFKTISQLWHDTDVTCSYLTHQWWLFKCFQMVGNRQEIASCRENISYLWKCTQKLNEAYTSNRASQRGNLISDPSTTKDTQ